MGIAARDKAKTQAVCQTRLNRSAGVSGGMGIGTGGAPSFGIPPTGIDLGQTRILKVWGSPRCASVWVAG